MRDKRSLRKAMRAKRRDYVRSLDDRMLALLFKRPPGAVLDLIPSGGKIGLYRETEFEAPAGSYARWFSENGYGLSLPSLADKNAAMQFADFTDPFGEADLENGPFGIQQPIADAVIVVPDVLIVPVVAFSPEGDRLGQGGGHYDRWLARHPAARTIGLAWDGQCCSEIPTEPHDRRLSAIVTPTCIYGSFA